MKAIAISKNGSLDNLKIQDFETPEIAPNQVLIRVRACGLNPADWKAALHGGFALPYILGTDISGIIEKTGAEITDFKKGDEVIGSLDWNKQGAFVEYVATETQFLAKKPGNLNFEEAAGIPMAALTAWQGLFEELHLQAGEKILIQAAAGGVGLFALQFAKWKGAYVVVTSSEKNIEFLKLLGADEVIDYNKTDFSKVLSNFDAVFDSLSDTEKSYQILKKGGRYLSIINLSTKLSEELAKSYDIIAKKFLFHSDAEQLNQIVNLIERGIVRVFIDKTFPLMEAKLALEYQKLGHSRGKNILIIQ